MFSILCVFFVSRLEIVVVAVGAVVLLKLVILPGQRKFSITYSLVDWFGTRANVNRFTVVERIHLILSESIKCFNFCLLLTAQSDSILPIFWFYQLFFSRSHIYWLECNRRQYHFVPRSNLSGTVEDVGLLCIQPTDIHICSTKSRLEHVTYCATQITMQLMLYALLCF